MTFSRTLRSLEHDRHFKAVFALTLVAILSGVWLTWLMLARVPVYVVSERARLEVGRAACPVASVEDGKVLEVPMSVGEAVEVGDVLIVLEAEVAKRRLEEAKANRDSLSARLKRFQIQKERMEQGLKAAMDAASLSIREAAEQFSKARTAADLAEEEATNLEKLQAAGMISQMEAQRQSTEARLKKTEAASSRLALDRMKAERARNISELQAQLEALSSEGERLSGEEEMAAATVQRFQDELERHLIRAPVAGRIEEMATLQVGTVIDAGTRLATILPESRLVVVGQFPPGEALGRILPGQRARIRLQGFPKLEYGDLGLTVTHVAGEVRDGSIQVRFWVEPQKNPTIPLRHGQPGTVMVEIALVSPADLILKAIGKSISQAKAPVGEGPA